MYEEEGGVGGVVLMCANWESFALFEFIAQISFANASISMEGEWKFFQWFLIGLFIWLDDERMKQPREKKKERKSVCVSKCVFVCGGGEGG